MSGKQHKRLRRIAKEQRLPIDILKKLYRCGAISIKKVSPTLMGVKN